MVGAQRCGWRGAPPAIRTMRTELRVARGSTRHDGDQNATADYDDDDDVIEVSDAQNNAEAKGLDSDAG